MISASLLTVISIDRYLTFVKQKFTCSQRAWYFKPHWLIFFAWVYGISLPLPIVYSTDFVRLNFTNNTVYYCTTTQGSTLFGRIYLLAVVLLGFVIPLATMILSYCRVLRFVWTRHRRLSSSVAPECNARITNAKLLERSRNRVLCVLLTVVICFVTCWLPFALYHGILERYVKETPNPMDTVRLITYGVGLASSMCNPFIYYFSVGGKSFRSMKRRFIEIMGGGTRPAPKTDGSCANHSRSASWNMMQLGFHPNNFVFPTPNCTLDNNGVKLAFTNEIHSSSGDGINTTL